MNANLSCPRLEELEAFVQDNTLAGEAAQIHGHLAHIHDHLARCKACRNAYESLLAKHTGAAVPRMTLSDDAPAADAGNFPFLRPAVQPDEIGRLGNYRVLRLLGQGGMGLVFLAEDIQLTRPVALKVMKPEMSGDAEGCQRFLREARAMAKIKHDHLVTIYGTGQEGDNVFFAMELLDGESLDCWIRRTRNAPAEEIVRLAREIASGLAFLHENNLVHRDIKPANIWLENRGNAPPRVKILDLGLVRSLADDASLTNTGIVLGTPEFMAPEQARGMSVDLRSDLFSLGGVLYYLCTRRKPFQGSTSVAVLMALASETPPSVRELNPRLPGELGDLVMQLLERNASKRPATAAEVLKRLEAIERAMLRGGEGPRAISSAPDTQVVLPLADSQVRKRRPGGGIVFWIGVFVVFAFVGIGVGTVLLTLRSTFFADKPMELKKPNDPPPPLVGNATFLKDLPEIQRENYPFKKGPDDKGPKKKKKDGKEPKEIPDDVRHKNKDFPRGISMHPPAPPNEGAPSSLTFKLDKQFKTFHAEVSLRDGPEWSETPCIFWVFADGKELWKSNPVSTQADAQKCNVWVQGVNELRIAVTCAGAPFGAHAVWIDPQLGK